MDWAESEYSQWTATRLALAGAWVQIVPAADACEACRAMAKRVYTPSEVPRLPIRGCTREVCRCRFEAVDPETELTVTQIVERGIHALRAGRHELARRILRRAVSLDEEHEQGWLWLSAVVDDADKVACLERVLAINPANRAARRGLQALRAEQADLAPVLSPIVESAAEVEALGAKRLVIVEQWSDLLSLVREIDPQVLLVQAGAFLEALRRADARALQLLSDGNAAPEVRRDELNAQWEASDAIGEALAGAIEDHRERDHADASWTPLKDTLAQLGQRVIDHRRQLRDRMVGSGIEPPG
ncbi:MAG: hypothetical protein JXA09_10470 [Anaerolineae bacterium]|nr:hypothetical protein [Anaerolineae bacterium]